MPPLSAPTHRLEKLFLRRKCWMLAELAQALDYALITVRRLLNQIGYFRSYTHNGKRYTLSTSPRFDHEGLWRHRGIGFSKHRTLTATMTHLVEGSPGGLSARELAQKLQHPCQAVLSQLHKNGALDRIKVAGEFRYLSRQPPMNHRQREHLAGEHYPSSSRVLETQTALFVLIEHIKNPELSFEQIARQVQQQRQRPVAAESIGRFFQEQGLKKTL